MSRTNIFLRGTTTGMVWRLLIVGALLPLFGDVLVSLGQRAGFYGAASVGMLHVLVVSTFFIAIIVAEGLSLRRVDAHRRESSRRVQESEARHRQLLDQLPHHIFSVDDDGRYVAVNAATCRFFRRTEAEIIGKTPAELGVSPGLVSLWLQQKAKTCATGMAQTLDLDVPVRGDVRSFRAITTPVRDLSGNIVGVSGIGIDTTDLRTAEAQSHRLAHAIEQLDEVVFMTDREGTITYVNPAFEKLYGFSPEEAVGKTPRILRSGELTQEFYASFWAELLAGRRTRGEYRNRRKDGTIVEVLGSASPVFGEDHSITGFIAVHEDVTAHNREAEARRQFEERVGHLARLESLGTLAGGMAHDFNNILSIILTHTDVLERRHDDPAVVARVMGTVRQAVQRGADLTRQILTFARRAELKAEAVDLGRLIMELGSMISETFPRTVQVTLDLDPDLPLVRADAGQIHQALLNLCINARDAMPAGGDLHVEARRVDAHAMRTLVADARDEDYVMLSVRDTGTGIDEETRKRIFEPFFTTKEKGKGTGLGLALVFGVVNNHGGLIDVESSVGQGTIFRLYLPLAQCAELPKVELSEKEMSGTETLLVIEDEPALRDAVSACLRVHGYRVRTAENGVDAITQCNAEGFPDAVVMDLGMPKMLATDVLHELHEMAPRLPVIAMTGYVDPAVHAEVVAAGVRRIVPKPFEMNVLLTTLREVL